MPSVEIGDLILEPKLLPAVRGDFVDKPNDPPKDFVGATSSTFRLKIPPNIGVVFVVVEDGFDPNDPPTEVRLIDD